MRAELQHYRELLASIKSHLEAHGDVGWARLLEGRIAELDRIQSGATPRESLVAHLMRSKAMTQGTDTLADLYLCEQAGHSLRDELEIISANEELVRLVDALYQEVDTLLARLAA